MHQPSNPESNPESIPASTPEQDLLAALAASQKTLGPTPRLVTQKPQVAMNAIKHQMTGQYLFMPAKELAEYLDMGHQLIEELRPVGMLEAQFAQRIVDATWRLNRSGSLDCIAVNTRVAIASRRVIAANPGGSEESHLVNSQALAANKECVDLIEKLGRYSSRTQRDMEKTIAALNAMKSSRIHKRGDQYSVETCPVYAWYRKLSNLTDRLVEAREEVQKKSVEEVTPKPAPAEAASDSEQTTSPEPLIHQTTRRLVTPLTPETEEIIRQAACYGLLLEDELSLLPQKAAA